MRELRVGLLCAALFGLLAPAFAGQGPADAEQAQTRTVKADPAGSPVYVRFAAHKDFDRLVLRLPAGSTAECRQDGAVVHLSLAGAGDLRGGPVAGRRITSMSVTHSGGDLRLPPNARVRSWRSGDMFVVDVFDPMPGRDKPALLSRVGATVAPAAPPGKPGPSTATTVPAASPVSSDRAPATSPAAAAGTIAAQVARDAPKQAVPADQPALQIDRSPAQTAQEGAGNVQLAPPHPISITLLKERADAAPSVLVPFGRDVGAAAFTRAGEARVVFDVPQSFDLSGLRDDPTFGGMTEQLMPDGMQLRFRLASGSALRLLKRDDGWQIVPLLGTSNDPMAPIIGRNSHGVTVFQANAPGRVVAVADELTGGRLLVGTQTRAGQQFGGAHLSSEAAVLPTWQGVVVQPISDRVVLRETAVGFELFSLGGPQLALTWPDRQTGTWPDGRTMTRLFDFVDAPPEVLHRSLGQALRNAAAAPKLARYGPRLSVAEAMLLQGMDGEAQAVLRTARADDPNGHDVRCFQCLAALASWMSARAAGEDSPEIPVDNARFGDSDEAVLLKSLLQPNSPVLSARAAAVAYTWPFLLNYPPMLRRFMLAPVADVLLRGGQSKALSAFLDAFPDPALDLARADFARDQGRTDDCLHLYDRVAGGRDRLARAKALEQAVVVRLAAKRTSPAAAADALNSQLYAWRGSDRELRLRQAVAKLRAQAGQWRSALAMLNETEQSFPQSHAEIHAAKTALVSDILKGDTVAKLSALDLVAIVDGTSDVLDAKDASFAPALIDKLTALDLGARAEPLLRRLFEEAKGAKTKAELGVRLATSILDEGDTAAALAILSASDDAVLDEALVNRRTLLRARLLEQAGKPAAALEALSSLPGQQAVDLRATIMESQHDWNGAESVLKSEVFDPGFAILSPKAQRDLVMRLARDEADSGDQTGLRTLRSTQSKQFTGADSALFAVLTSEPVRSTADLPRSKAEVATLRSVSASMGHNSSL